MPYFMDMCEFLCVSSGRPTVLFLATSAADTAADCPPQWYKPMIRTAAKREKLVISYTLVTAAAGVHQPRLVTARLCTPCRAIQRLTAAIIAANG